MIYLPSTVLTRPNDTNVYASGDLIANSTTAGSVALQSIDCPTNGFAFRADRVLIRKSDASVTTCSIRVHLFTALPSTFANGDNGVFSSNGAAGHLGYFDVTIDRAFTDGATGFSAFTQHNVLLPSNSRRLWIALEARSAYTPAANETFIVTIQGTDSL